MEIFGEIVDGEMKLNKYGDIVKDEWFKTARLRTSISLYLDEMVVMLNHVHGIIWINEMNAGDDSKGVASLRPYLVAHDSPLQEWYIVGCH